MMTLNVTDEASKRRQRLLECILAANGNYENKGRMKLVNENITECTSYHRQHV